MTFRHFTQFLSVFVLINFIGQAQSDGTTVNTAASGKGDESLAAESKALPTGYYAFARAHPNAVPPKVRKPPYMFIDSACPGVYDQNSLMPKNNLCGDLNKGFVPRSPLPVHEHPGYPFEIIKNKTLQYLSKTLPHLKNEIDSIPKVARFMKPSQFFEHHLRRRSKRSTVVEKKANEPVSETKSDNSSATLVQQSRHQCSGNAICHALESLREEGPLSKSFLSSVVSAVGNMALEHYNQQAQSAANNVSNKSSPSSKLNTILTLTQLLSSTLSESSASASAASSPSSPSSSSSASSTTSSTVSSSSSDPGSHPQPSMYSPLVSIIDYVQSLQTPKSRKSSDDDGLDQQLSERPQTPCQSSEEYISPTYARNYQGVWKYVVQIPDEGYFTQTVQQTSCVKAKCDLLEGACRESPRWVSLLVAEIFYPDVYFPVNQSPEDGFITGNADQTTLAALAAEIAKQQQQQQQQQQNVLLKPEIQHALQQQQQFSQHPQQTPAINGQNFHVMNSNHHNLNKLQRPQQTKQHSQTMPKQQPQQQTQQMHQQAGQPVTQRHPAANNAQMQAHHELMLANMLKRQDKLPLNHGSVSHRRGRLADAAVTNAAASADPSEDKASAGDSIEATKKQCDGYDKIGCYNIRVYYDWFLVNGSCKCHRTSVSGLNGINETIKRIFIGKWK